MAKWRIALWALIVVVAAAFLYAVRAILIPFALAWIIAVLLEPMVRRLRLRGMSRGGSVLTVTVAFFVLIGGVIAYTAPRISAQIGELRGTFQTLAQGLSQENPRQSHFERWNPKVQAAETGPLVWIDRTLEEVHPTLTRFGLPTSRRAIYDQYIEPQQENIAGAVSGFFNGFLRILGSAASQLLILPFVPIFAFMMLMEMEKIKVRSVTWIPPSLRRGAMTIAADIGEVFKKYLRGVTINIALYSTFSAIVLGAMGTPYSLPLALLSGVLFLIPMLGGALNTITIFLVVGLSGKTGGLLFQTGSPWIFALIVTIVFFLLSTIYDMMVTPRVIGKAVNLHPLVSMFVVFSGGALFGLPGMIIAFPLAGSIKVTLTRLFRIINQPSDDAEFRLPAVPVRHRTSASSDL